LSLPQFSKNASIYLAGGVVAAGGNLHAAGKARAVQISHAEHEEGRGAAERHQRRMVREVGERRTVLPLVDGGEPAPRREDPVPHGAASSSRNDPQR